MNLRDFGEDESVAAMTQFLLQRKAKYHASCRSKFHDKRRKLSSKVSDNCPSQQLTHPHQDPSCLLSTTPTRSQETTPHRQNATHSTPTSSRRMPWSFASTPDIGLTPDIGQSVTVSVTLRLGYRMLTWLFDHSEGLSGTGCCGCWVIWGQEWYTSARIEQSNSWSGTGCWATWAIWRLEWYKKCCNSWVI